MKLVFYPWEEEFNIADHELNLLIIEGPRHFESFVNGIVNHIGKQSAVFYCEMNAQEHSLDSFGDVILSPYDLCFEKKSTQRALYKILCSEITGTTIESQIADLNSKKVHILDEICSQSEFSIDYGEYFGVIDFFKDNDIQLIEPSGSFVERLMDYCATILALLKKDFFFIVNCGAYLEDFDYEKINQFAQYEGITIILVDQQQRENIKGFNEIIVDIDLCII